MPQKQDDSLARSWPSPEAIQLLGGLTGTVISIGLSFGIAVILGKCLAIGSAAFSYITVADVGANALIISPAVFALFSAITLHEFSQPEPVDKPVSDDGLKPTSRLVVIPMLVAWFAAFLFLPPFLYGVTEFGIGSILTIFIFDTIRFYARRSGRVLTVVPFATVCAFFVMIMQSSYLGTSIKLHLPVKPNSEWAGQEICLDPCMQGRVIARFSEVTVIRRGQDSKIAFVSNSEIKSVTEQDAPTDAPLIDLRALKSWQ
jgi:hypothetical protein